MAQREQPDHSGAAITSLRVEPYQNGVLLLASAAIDADGRLDPIHSRAGDDLSPALSWSGPPGVVSYALVVEDPDAPMARPYVHWLMWDIPGSLHDLPRGIDPRRAGPGGAVQGRNDAGGYGWTGMAPPPGHGPHRYYFQLFGLDRRLDLDRDMPLDKLTNVLKASAVAKGQLIGTFENPGSIMDQPSPARTVNHGRGGLDRDDVDRHAPHSPSGEVRRPRPG